MVRENLARAERVTHLYTYKERRTDIHTNPFGRLGTGGTSVFDVYPSPTRRLGYRRLIERDGKPIPAASSRSRTASTALRVHEVMREKRLRTPDREVGPQQESEGGAAAAAARHRGRRSTRCSSS